MLLNQMIPGSVYDAKAKKMALFAAHLQQQTMQAHLTVESISLYIVESKYLKLSL